MKPMGLGESLLFFGIPTLLLYLATHVCIPLLSSATGLPVVVAWFICGGLLVFMPLFVAAFVFYRIEGQPWKISAILTRFRLNHLSWRDLAWSLLSVLGVGVFTYGIIEVGQHLVPGFSAQPSFMTMTPLQGNDLWILAAWLPLFFFNIWGKDYFGAATSSPGKSWPLAHTPGGSTVLCGRCSTWRLAALCW